MFTLKYTRQLETSIEASHLPIHWSHNCILTIRPIFMGTEIFLITDKIEPKQKFPLPTERRN